MRNKRVLVDCDGVMADFLTRALEVINESGSSYVHDDVTEFEICSALGIPEMWDTLRRACAQEGFVSSLKPIPNALAGLSSLRRLHEVVAVTSPMSVRNWAFEREEWLMKYMGFKKDEIVQTSGKHLIQADVIVDDRIDNVLSWISHHPNGLGIIFPAPHNKTFVTEQENVLKTTGWENTVLLCERHFWKSS